MSRAGGAGRVLDGAGGTGVMAAVLGVMLFLLVLAAALGLAARGASDRLGRRLAGRVTVQLVDGDAAARDRAAAAALAALRASPAVTAARAVPADELRRLLAPWLGDAGTADAVPLPAMIDADLREPFDLSAVRAAVLAAAPAARVDAAGAWMAPVSRLLEGAAALAALLVGLTAAATLAVVALAARAALEAHRSTVEVLHVLGSTDGQVARLFQRRAGRDALLGGGLGGLAGLVAARGAGELLGALGSELVGGAALSSSDWLLLAALPFALAGLAALAAGRAVTGELRSML